MKDAKVTLGGTSFFDQAMPMLWVSKLAYVFADLFKAQREGTVTLKYPAKFPDDFKFETKFKDESVDVRNYSGDGNGMPFNVLLDILLANKDAIKLIREEEEDYDYVIDCLEKLNEYDDQLEGDDLYVETFRSYYGSKQCVYGVMTNTMSKRIIITFRGSLTPSEGNRDWQSNFNAYLSPMETPALLKGKLEGKLNERLMMHKGFYDYLFDNEFVHKDDKQRYGMILDDIKPLLENRKDYKVFLTGHSLGAALCSLAAFKLASEDLDWLPKPISCISYASPLTATSDYRAAFEQLEREKMIRYIRVTNHNDPICSSLPVSISLIPRGFKHVGINVRLYDDKKPDIHHTTTAKFKNVMQNSLFKNPINTLKEHDVRLYDKRMRLQMEAFESITVEDLYADETIVKFDTTKEVKCIPPCSC